MAGVWLFTNSVALNAQPLVASQAERDALAWKRYPIEVYCSKTSITQGQSINVMVANGDSNLVGSQYQIQVIRVGATDSVCYTAPGTFSLQYQPLHNISGAPIMQNDFRLKPYDFKTGCTWPIAFTVTGATTSSWKSGFYYVKCSLVNNSALSRRAPFVVRQAIPGSTSNILYKVPFNTYNAYNSWGGSNLYSDNDTALVQFNDTVSFLRPMGGRSDQSERTDIGSFDLAERYFIQWAEASNYVMEYCANVDLDNDPSHNFIRSYKFIVTSGHDEYWTQDERDDVEKSFIPEQSIGGGNAAFVSGNICYWKATYTPDRTRMVVDKHRGNSSYFEDSLWRSSTIGKPEAKFIGVQFDLPAGNNWHWSGVTDTVRLPAHWLFKGVNPSYQLGQAFGVGLTDTLYAAGPGVVGGEVDRTFIGSSPSNVEILSSVKFSNGIRHEAGFYINTSSNARVFGAGSIYWSRGLQGSVSSDRNNFRTIMTNLMDHFSEKKFVGPIYGINNKWAKNVEIDGNTTIVAWAALKLDNMTLTINEACTLFVQGTLAINGNVTITGPGKLNYPATLSPTWNMVSIPVGVADYRKSVVYPSAASNAFTFNGSTYVVKDTLSHGIGYWVKYNSPLPSSPVTYTGTPTLVETVSVNNGWNMIGSISVRLPVSKVVTIPSGIRNSNYFSYNGIGYPQADTLYPGKAYWVKASSAGKFILNAFSTANTPPISSSPLPPPPPETPPPSAPVLSATAYGSTNPKHPLLSWTSVGANMSYSLLRYQCAVEDGDCNLAGSPVYYQGSSLSYLDNAVDMWYKTGPPAQVNYFYKVQAKDPFNQVSPYSNKESVLSGNYGEISKAGFNPVREGRALPAETKLKRNYPNPFNPSTTISYQRSSQWFVKMVIFNALGQEVTALVHEQQEAGYYEVVWDGSSQSSGLYYLKLLVADESGKELYRETKKMVLMK